MVQAGGQSGMEASEARGCRKFWKAIGRHPVRVILLALVLLLGLTIGFADRLLANPLRHWAERTINSNLKGYSVRIEAVHPHLWKWGVDLEGIVLVQVAHPEPPVADFGALRFSIIWKELLHRRVVGDLTIDQPALHINLAQIKQEASHHVSLKEQGWQAAVESIYPIKLDALRIRNGSVLYVSDDKSAKPLQLTKIFMEASNVRNIATIKGHYPSPFQLEGVLFDTGKIWFRGAADFLRKPSAAAQGEVHLEHVPLDRLTPIAQSYQLKTSGGFLSLDGDTEYTPEAQTAHLSSLLIEDLKVDYVTSAATEALEREHARQVERVGKSLRNAPKMRVQVDRFRLARTQIGFENLKAKPHYRLALSSVNLEIKDLNNQAKEGQSEFQGEGVFMQQGRTILSGHVRPAANSADFDVELKLDDANLPDLNDFLLASTGVDVAQGQLSVYTELTVRNGRVNGYIKPLLQNLKVYQKGKDQNKSFGKRVEMHVLQFFSFLLKNHSTQKVATVIPISGSTNSPQFSEWSTIGKLIANGFFKAILPGFVAQPADSGTGSGAAGNSDERNAGEGETGGAKPGPEADPNHS